MALADAVTRDRSSVRVTSGKVVGAAGNRARVLVSGSELTLPRLAWYPVTAGDTVNILVSDAGWLVLGPTGAVTGGGGGTGSPGPAGRSVSSATVNNAGRLILTMSDDTTIDAGYVVGPAGSNGTNGSNGAPGAAGADGVSVVDVDIDANQHLIVTLSNGATIDAGAVAGGSSPSSPSYYRTAGLGPVRMSEQPTKYGLDAAYSAFPVTTRLTDGRLAMVWRQGTDHVTARDGMIRISWSSDEGRTWTTPTTAVPYPGGGVDLRDPSITASSNGSTLWLTYFKGTSSLAAAGCFLRISTNNGASWGAEIRIDPNLPYAAVCAPVVQVGSKLLVPYYGRSGSETRDSVFVATSTDGGATWTSARIANGATDSRDYQEPWLLSTGNGLVCLYRWNSAESIALSRSTNGGTSWTAAAVAFAGTGRPSAAWTSTGVLVVIYRRISDGAAVYKASRDNGATWYFVRVSQIITGSGWMTYAGPVEVAPGMIFCPVGIESSNGSVSAIWLSYVFDGGGISPIGDTFGDAITRLAADADIIVAADDFDRPDSSGPGFCLTGQPWQTPTGAMRVESSTLRSAAADGAADLAWVETGNPHVFVEGDVAFVTSTAAGGLALIARYVDANNYLILAVEAAASIVLYTYVAGVLTARSTVTSLPMAAGIYHRLGLAVHGNQVDAYINRRIATGYTLTGGDATALAAGTKHGFRANETSGSGAHRLRRFLVRAP